MANNDELLGRSDPFNFWLQEASFHSSPVSGISPVEALTIIKNAFSESWLTKVISAVEKGTALQSSRHPLANLILTPGRNQISRVLELGIYLRALFATPNISQVITQMKSASDFENTWIQLAYGYRFLKIGAEDLRFEPVVQGGRKADIIFRFESQIFIVECYMPDAEESWAVEFSSRIHKQIFDFSTKNKKVVSLKVFLRDFPPFSPDERKIFNDKWKTLIRNSSDVGLVVFKNDFFKVQIQEISKLTQNERKGLFEKTISHTECRFAYRQSLMEKKEALNVMRGQSKEMHTSDMVFFFSNKKDRDIGELVNHLSKKMEKKVQQLKMKDSGAKGILIVASPIIHPRNTDCKKDFERLRGKVIDTHAHVDAAILAHGTYGPTGDPRFGGTFFQSSLKNKPSSLLDKLEGLEMKGALLI